MTVSVVTPWLDHPELSPDYFAALRICGLDDVEIIIVDNGSDPPRDDSHIRFNENVGFCRASNAGLYEATGDIVLFLNNDIAATIPGWLARLTDAVEPGVLVGAKIRHDEHGRVDGQRLPYLDGWCIAGLREDLLDLGGFSEDLVEPGYYSDNLLCLEARARGMTLRQIQTGLRHKVGRTTGGASQEKTAAILANYQTFASRARQILSQTPVAA